MSLVRFPVAPQKKETHSRLFFCGATGAPYFISLTRKRYACGRRPDGTHTLSMKDYCYFCGMESAVSVLARQASLLRIEYEEEKEAYLVQSKTMPVQRKIKRGICWYPVRCGQAYYNSLNQLVVEILRTSDRDVEHSFEYGRPVCFFTQDTQKNESRFLPVTGTVSYVDDDRMVVALPQGKGVSDLTSAQNLGVQLFFDETTYRLMFEALNQVINAEKGRTQELREIIHGNIKPSWHTFQSITLPWLNPTQQEAVNRVLAAKDVAVVHGPPGTGKTTTLVEAIYETLRREDQVLVCAQSNMAVDWISEKLVDHGISVLRVGNPTRVNDKMLSFTYERRFEDHPDYSQLWAIRKNIRELSARKKDDSTRRKLNSLRDHATELEQSIRHDLLREARVIACTLTGSANRILAGKRFSTLFIDEAGQALEAACWIALRKSDRIILAGDHQQLPPTVKSMEAQRGGLDRTMMQHLATTRPECVTLLKVQYRMNDAIMRFSSDWFYGGMLESDPGVRFRSILDLDNPIVWINTEGMDCNEQFVGESFGRINKAEAQLSIQHLKDYIGKIGRERIIQEHIDFGLISPYRAQVQYLRQLVKEDPFFKPYRSLISINTVDGFQGQERDVIIISLVRANENGEIGFLKDLRRMNVAMTRARMKLIILADASTLTRHPFYQKLFEHIQSLR